MRLIERFEARYGLLPARAFVFVWLVLASPTPALALSLDADRIFMLFLFPLALIPSGIVYRLAPGDGFSRAVGAAVSAILVVLGFLLADSIEDFDLLEVLFAGGTVVFGLAGWMVSKKLGEYRKLRGTNR